MHLDLRLALTGVNLLVPIGLGVAVGLLSARFGLRRGSLLTPLLITFSIPPTTAAAADTGRKVVARQMDAVKWLVGMMANNGSVFGADNGTCCIRSRRGCRRNYQK